MCELLALPCVLREVLVFCAGVKVGGTEVGVRELLVSPCVVREVPALLARDVDGVVARSSLVAGFCDRGVVESGGAVARSSIARGIAGDGWDDIGDGFVVVKLLATVE